jgi:hypothetical protein
MAGWKSNAGADKEELRDRGPPRLSLLLLLIRVAQSPFNGKSPRRTVTIGFPPKSPSSTPLMSNAVLAAASIEERWFLNISRPALGFLGYEGSILANISELTYTRTALKGLTSIGSMNIQNPIAFRR